MQIVLYSLVYVLFYKIYYDSQAGTLSCCHNEDIDDMNETIELDHDIRGNSEFAS